MAVFEHEQVLPCRIESAFDFLARPANIVRLSEPDAKLSFVDEPEVISAGIELEFEIQAFGMPTSLVHAIIDVDRPRRIFERMIHGPLNDFEHEHLFEEHDSGTLLVDRIRFEPPGGMIGLVLNEQRIRTSLQKSFNYRRQQLEHFIAAGELV